MLIANCLDDFETNVPVINRDLYYFELRAKRFPKELLPLLSGNKKKSLICISTSLVSVTFGGPVVLKGTQVLRSVSVDSIESIKFPTLKCTKLLFC